MNMVFYSPLYVSPWLGKIHLMGFARKINTRIFQLRSIKKLNRPTMVPGDYYIHLF